MVDILTFFKALADHNRLEIVRCLSQGERCVCEIYGVVGLPQNLVSHHLKVLKGAGVVETRKDGTWVHYRLNKKNLAACRRALGKELKIA